MAGREDALDQDGQGARLALVQADHFLLHQALKFVLREDAVEVLKGRAQETLARRACAEEDGHGAVADFGGDHLKGGKVEVFLALEVVVEECLVDAGNGGDPLGAGAGEAVRAEFLQRGIEDACAGSRRRGRSVRQWFREGS